MGDGQSVGLISMSSNDVLNIFDVRLEIITEYYIDWYASRTEPMMLKFVCAAYYKVNVCLYFLFAVL